MRIVPEILRYAIEKDQLHLKSPDIGDWALSPISETEFVCLDGGDSVTFVKGADGRYDQVNYWDIVHLRKKVESNRRKP